MNNDLKIIPIVFAFDDNLKLPAAVCLSSLLSNAYSCTFYDVFILHSADSLVERDMLNKVEQYYKNCRITYINVTGFFQDGYEVRGITKATYYRLLIPRLIAQYSKVIYADVDMIFRMDLSELYDTNIDNVCVAATYDMGMLLTEAGKKHISSLGVEDNKYIQAGLLLFNCQKIREEDLESQFLALYKNNYKFQDQDILNVTCAKKHLRLPMKYNMTDYSFILLREGNDFFKNISASEINEALETGNLHYNGHKPWKKFSLNFDIWWEYYRKSPVFDMEYYIDFYYDRLNLFDQLSLWKRIKILLRYFVYGKRKI